ncbi:MAG: hypothetical protein JWP25_2564 [Bradyrhizobium sp.]|nr:hypothetical protein [Bradyrhizobium sp.]
MRFWIECTSFEMGLPGDGFNSGGGFAAAA